MHVPAILQLPLCLEVDEVTTPFSVFILIVHSIVVINRTGDEEILYWTKEFLVLAYLRHFNIGAKRLRNKRGRGRDQPQFIKVSALSVVQLLQPECTPFCTSQFANSYVLG